MSGREGRQPRDNGFRGSEEVEEILNGQRYEYPARRPFINSSDIVDPPIGRAVRSTPDSSREAIMSALINLQQKVHSLERERKSAENGFQSLSAPAENHRYDSLSHPLQQTNMVGQTTINGGHARQQRSTSSSPYVGSHKSPLDSYIDPKRLHDASYLSSAHNDSYRPNGVDEVHGKLEQAQDRCRQLEHELNNMQQLLREAERVNRIGASIQTSPVALKTSSKQPHSAGVNGKSSHDKIEKLEREHMKLTASQTVAENKLRQLEQQVLEEKVMRKMQGQRQQFDKDDDKDVPIDFIEEDRPVKLKKKKKKKSISPRETLKSRPCVNNPAASGPLRREPTTHYKLNLADIPFISGKSTAQSHSLPANFQEVLSLMKNHNARLCHNPHQHLPQDWRSLQKQSQPVKQQRPKLNGQVTSDDLSDLLQQLQDEFGQLSLEHEELLDQLREVSDVRLREALEADLDRIVSRMEAKGQQISRLKGHRDELMCTRTEAVDIERPHSAGARLLSDEGTVEVTTTVKTRGKGAGNIVVSPQPTNRALASLSLYKDIKKIQTTLRKDDITWDC